MPNPITVAVAPLKQEAIDKAVERMQARINAMLATAPAGADFNAVFPRPHSRMSRAAYLQARSLRNFAACVVTYSHSTMPNRPEPIVCSNEVGIMNLLRQAAEQAGADFDAYVAKLTKKVGECDKASIDGSSLWQGSTLTVTKGSTVERWKTTQIINVSVLGKLFNQWPTRKLK